MEIKYKSKFDLFKRGFYVMSFDMLEDVEEYLENYAKEHHKFKNSSPVDEMNQRRFSIIVSKHAEFS